MHPGEQHMRTEALKAIADHFSATTLHLEGVPFTFDWAPSTLPGHGETLTVHAADGREVARYRISVTPTKVGSPLTQAVAEEIAQVPTVLDRIAEPTPPASPSWSDGAWREVASGCLVIDEAGKVWEVTRQDTRTVTIACGDESYTFTPGADDAVKYSPRSEGV